MIVTFDLIYLFICIWLESILCAEVLALLVAVICSYQCYTTERLHWFEIHDQNWCPTVFKIFLRQLLREMVWIDGLRAAKPVSRIITKIIMENKISYILDLCSGTCGPSKIINENINENIDCLQLHKKHKIITILTDLFPQIDSWKAICQKNENYLTYSSKPIDATNINMQQINKIIQLQYNDITANSPVLRSIFLAFHHFSPQLCMQILRDTFDKKDAIIITDFVADKSIFGFFLVWFTFSVLGFIGTMKIIKSWLLTFKIKNIFYGFITVILFPIFQFSQIHDALISNGRMYSEKRLQEMSNICVKGVKREMEYEFKYIEVDINANTYGVLIPSELQKSVIYVFACIPIPKFT